MDTLPMIIDTDAGVDDAIALMLALADPAVEIQAFTTVVGNVNIEQATRNICMLLEILGRDIPVYKGAHQSLSGKPFPFSVFMGEDGLGNISRRYPCEYNCLQKLHGAEALVNLCIKSPRPPTLVALGPLTNVALALHLEPSLPQYISRLVLMGGTSTARGNTTPATEFNIYVDPEAASLVLNAGFSDVWILPWETALNQMLPWSIFDELSSMGTTAAKLFIDFTVIARKSLKDQFHLPGMPMADPLTMLVALHPEWVRHFEELRVDIETTGNFGRGLMAIDWMHLQNLPANAHIVTEMNEESIRSILLSSLKAC